MTLNLAHWLHVLIIPYNGLCDNIIFYFFTLYFNSYLDDLKRKGSTLSILLPGQGRLLNWR